MKTKLLLSLVAAATLAATSLPAAAQAQPGRKVNRDELRKCLNDGDALRARSDALKAAAEKARPKQEELQAERTAIEDEIKRQESATNQSMGIATGNPRERLERRKRMYEAKVQDVKAETDKLNGEADQLKADLAKYNEGCSGITYDKEDREAIEKERGSKK
ncbi:hypothetical protein [Ramlibacter algicola]|uniref:Uncharacterized protein n=1 Tax=Ramlibacter algicola TaxID=2795217 RepID=A0A934PY75_9BURK|nr:hypothetical protein [Ramlibacter algicola]MBK0391558.1 hypothetical protein [Ramlibacter algicola]